MDGDSTKISEYAEGTHWSKGRVIGTGAYCTCFLARDMKSGTIMAVKQVLKYAIMNMLNIDVTMCLQTG